MNWETINNQLLQKSKIKIRVKEGTLTTIPYYNNMLVVSFSKYEVREFEGIAYNLQFALNHGIYFNNIPNIMWFSNMINEIWYSNRGKIFYKKVKDVIFFHQIHKVPEVSVLIGYNIKTKKAEFYLHTMNFGLQRINLNQRGITLNPKGNKKMFHSNLKKYKKRLDNE